ncbi:MAG: hypothetical protein V9E87_11785 [Gemmatimonadales bacterium]
MLNLKATLLVVSHDRAFLDNVVTSTLVMEGGGRVGEYVGGYTDWARQRQAVIAMRRVANAERSRRPRRRPSPPRSPPPRAPRCGD